jgi:uncharacterized protein (TIGR03086 family)
MLVAQKEELIMIEDVYARAAREFEARVAQVSAGDWQKTTRCCPDWTIRDLVNHVVGENRWILPLVGGSTIADVGESLSGDLLGDDALAAWKQASDDVASAIRDPENMARAVELSSGQTVGSAYVVEVVSDQIIHTWDLASSIDADTALPDELVEFASATLTPLAEAWRQAGVLGPPVDVQDDADAQTKLLAMLGRRA